MLTMAAMNETSVIETKVGAPAVEGLPFIGGSCALILRTSFLLIQLGCVPVPDLKMLVLQNVMDLASGTMAYCLMGYSFAYGRDVGGFAGADRFFMTDLGDGVDAVRGWAAATTASGLFTMGVAGRLHPVGAAASSAWLCGLSAALLQHWAWHEGGWCRRHFFFVDRGGAGPVHVCGGAAALVGLMMLGRRALRVDQCSLPKGSETFAVAGYLLAILSYAGLVASSHPSTAGLILVNVVVAAAGGWAAAALFGVRSETLDRWTLLRIAQGGVCGCVMMVAGAGLYTAPLSLLLGFLGGALSCALSLVWDVPELEDNASVVPCSIVCGFLGALAVPVSGNLPSIETSTDAVVQLGRQFLCVAAMLATAMLLHAFICFILVCLRLFRNRAELEAHQRALSALGHSKDRPFFHRLFSVGEPRSMQPDYQHDRGKDPAVVSGSNLNDTNHTPKPLRCIPPGCHAELGDQKPSAEKSRNSEVVKKYGPLNRTRHFRKARQRRKRFVHTLSGARIGQYQITEVRFENEKTAEDAVRDEEGNARCLSVVEAEVYEQPAVTATRHTLGGQVEANSCPELDYLVYRKYESLLQRNSLEKCVSCDDAKSSGLAAGEAISVCQFGQCKT